MEQMKIRMGNRIRELRKEKGISQVGLARALKMSASYLSMVESGKRMPSVELLILISEYLGVSVNELLYASYGEHMSVQEGSVEKAGSQCQQEENKRAVRLREYYLGIQKMNVWKKHVTEGVGECSMLRDIERQEKINKGSAKILH